MTTYIKIHKLKKKAAVRHLRSFPEDRFPFSHLDKSGAACLALVWLFSRVDAGVGLEVGWSVELSTADVAVVGLRTWTLRSAGFAMTKTVHDVNLMSL